LDIFIVAVFMLSQYCVMFGDSPVHRNFIM
jgi:hypothetical protein